MHPVNLMAMAVREQPDCPRLPEDVTPEPGICAITGQEAETVPRSLLLGRSFCDRALLAMPDSNRVSLDAWIALKYKWQRMSSWICTPRFFQRLDRVGVRQVVMGEPPHEPWMVYATTSYKKHGVLRARINQACRARLRPRELRRDGPAAPDSAPRASTRRAYRAVARRAKAGAKAGRVYLFENRLVDLSDTARTRRWWQRLNQALRAGFGRTVLETLDCPPYLIGKVGVGPWLEFSAWARPRHKSAMYAFLCYLLPSQAELRAERAEQKKTLEEKENGQELEAEKVPAGEPRQLTFGWGS